MRKLLRYVLILLIGFAFGRVWEAGDLLPRLNALSAAVRDVASAANAPSSAPIMSRDDSAPAATALKLATATQLAPTITQMLPTATPLAPTITPIPASATQVPPTATGIPPTATPIPPTATLIPPTVAPASARFAVTRFASPRQRYTHGQVNLRLGPDTSYALAGSVVANSALQVIGQSGDWYLIRHGGRELYIAGWLTFDAPLQQPVQQQPVQQQPARQQAVQQQPAQQQPAQQRPAQQQPVQQQPAQQQPVQQQPVQQQSYICNCGKTCGQMSSCEEAYFQLRNCGCGRRDSDKDGVPCENICPGG